jgi:NAD(P) transhydrogenase subunit alpha
MSVNDFSGLYIFMLAAFAGWVIIGNVPAILHTPLMSGSNFVHGIGFVAVLLGAGNAAGGYAVTDRMLGMFRSSDAKPRRHKRSAVRHRVKAN